MRSGRIGIPERIAFESRDKCEARGALFGFSIREGSKNNDIVYLQQLVNIGLFRIQPPIVFCFCVFVLHPVHLSMLTLLKVCDFQGNFKHIYMYLF